MVPNPAQYLLRFDDLCPTLLHERWQRCLHLVQEFGIQPILAVVPENRDPQLVVDERDPEFWPQMRALEAAGAAIALHGYRHLCHSAGHSLLSLHSRTEFSGVHEETQRQWIHSGLEILRSHGLNPRLWVAPRHGFDRATLRALRSEGITALSDGFARVPFLRGGVTWIPQQLWGAVEKSNGLWTICLHPNSISIAQLDALEIFLRTHHSQFTSVDRVLADLHPSRLSLLERTIEWLALTRIRASRLRKLMRRKKRKS